MWPTRKLKRQYQYSEMCDKLDVKGKLERKTVKKNTVEQETGKMESYTHNSKTLHT